MGLHGLHDIRESSGFFPRTEYAMEKAERHGQLAIKYARWGATSDSICQARAAASWYRRALIAFENEYVEATFGGAA